ncbi:glutathione S-transferase [Parasphingorhabdus litoris]|uniref:Glutathione S-transferase n=1 Tax=Parasphingorhabdus litoris TaxID=394733 RepID=A0ABP3KE19_9SPHN|nr:glutathione S-transferase family protein [Parasphingorhabdus litoris]
MTLKLFHSPGTRSIRALWLLEEMGLPYELKSMEYNGAYFASDQYRSINPMGKVPALYDDGELVIESTAIMEYLLHRHGPSSLSVSSENPEYATYLQWLHMAESGMANYISVSFGQTYGKDPYKVSEQFDTYCRFQITKALEMLEIQLKDREYLLESGFSAADISLGYTLFFAQACTGTKFSETVGAYFNRLASRPAFQKALSDLPKQQSF